MWINTSKPDASSSQLCICTVSSVLYLLSAKNILGVAMSDGTRYYKGTHKVKVVTKSAGYWIIEALEEFGDMVEGEKVMVKVGERRIVPSNTVRKRERLSPPVKEHAYELKMEKKLKQIVAESEKTEGKKKKQ